MKPKSPVQKNNLVVFPYEYTRVYPYRYTWYICIAMMKYTSLQEYLYPLIQQKSLLKTSLAITLTHTRTHTRNCKSLYGSYCLATDASLTADPGVASSIPARSHTFVEIDHEIISTVILLPSAVSFKKGCC